MKPTTNRSARVIRMAASKRDFKFWMLVGLISLSVSAVSGEDPERNPVNFDYPALVNKDVVSAWEAWGGNWVNKAGVLTVTDGNPGKALLKQIQGEDFELIVQMRAQQGGQAGVIFRVSRPGPRVDQYEGYFVGIHASQDTVVWGSADGNWHSIASRSVSVPANQWFDLRLVVRGTQIQAWINQTAIPVKRSSTSMKSTRYPKFDGIDQRYHHGSIGFRTLGSGAEFRNLVIQPIEPQTLVTSYSNPVQVGCADPGVILFEGTYYAFCTHTPDHPTMSRGIRLHTSKNLVDWEDRGFVINREESWGESRFWAPDIIQRDDAFYLYYAADERICVAKAPHPTGPFQQIGHRPITPASIRIDAHVFRDDDSKFYFYYVHFNQGNEIWGGELNNDMVTVKPETLRRMIMPDQPWEQHGGKVTEGPTILKHGDTYYLTYSGSHFESPHYAVGYATSKHPLGPWRKHTHNPIMKSTSYAHGTAHHGFTTSPDKQELFIVYHRHFDLNRTEPRQLAIDRAQFVECDNGPAVLEIHGPTSSPQPLPSGASLGLNTDAAQSADFKTK